MVAGSRPGRANHRQITRRRAERGQALPITVLLVAFALLAALGVARLARDTAARSAAQHAADAVALAGAIDGRSGADAVAARNDATIVRFEQHDDVVSVEIHRRGARGRASAELVVEIAD